jgi:MFS family permease
MTNIQKENMMVETNFSRYRWVILAIYMYVAALTQLYWLNFAAIDTYVEMHLQISAMRTSTLTIVFPLIFMILSIPAGIIIDKKGFKYGVGIGTVLTGVFAIIRLASPNSYGMLLFTQIGISVGQPFVLNAITKLSITWFPKKEEATAVGLGSLSLFLGMIVGLGLTPFLVQSLGFHTMILIYGILGIIGIAIFFLFVKPEPSIFLKHEGIGEVSYWDGIKKISKIRDFIILGFIALIGIGVFNGLLTWLEKILTELHNMSMVNAGNISSILVFSGMFGCIIIPIISDKIRKRKPFLMLASIVGVATLLILMFAGSFLANVANAVIMGFFVVSTLPIMLTMSAEITGRKYVGIASAYLQLLGNGAAVAIVPLVEMLRSATGKYNLSLIFLAVLFGLVFILTLFMKESAKSIKENA